MKQASIGQVAALVFWAAAAIWASAAAPPASGAQDIACSTLETAVSQDPASENMSSVERSICQLQALNAAFGEDRRHALLFQSSGYLRDVGRAAGIKTSATVADAVTPSACGACHVDGAVLPDAHPPVEGMTMNGCRDCHVPGTPLALEGRLHLDHTHYLSGLECATCHENAEAPEEPETRVCLDCHGPLEALGARSADASPTNPHSSPHGAPFAECSLCHLQHAPQENYCASCHNFKFTFP
ncbi:cytochrome c3 family protein [Martelella sp. AD-3]|uniref:cytochrome c3 family protein n=1 Tax=Martelella sp. AD-3 TaxID=686597 RepID=UPI0004638863|nr:cytochrome c3 family protein [Martelella sp. AD-3]AMM84202.1 hypothetical protein AZF01_07400 [Martelella sp. AD-3]